MKKAFFFSLLILMIIPVPVSGKGLPEDFISFYDICIEKSNTCRKEFPNNINMFLSWTSDTHYIISFGNNNPDNITGVYGVEVKLRSDFDMVEIIALGNDIIVPKKAENGIVVFDYDKEIAAGGYGKAFITLTNGQVEETKPITSPPSTTITPSTTMPPTTQPPVTTTPETGRLPKPIIQPATKAPVEIEVVEEEPFWKPLQGLIITIALSAIIAFVIIKSGVLEPPE